MSDTSLQLRFPLRHNYEPRAVALVIVQGSGYRGQRRRWAFAGRSKDGLLICSPLMMAPDGSWKTVPVFATRAKAEAWAADHGLRAAYWSARRREYVGWDDADGFMTTPRV